MDMGGLTAQVGYDLILADNFLRHMLIEDAEIGSEVDSILDTNAEIHSEHGTRIPFQGMSSSSKFSEAGIRPSIYLEADVLQTMDISRNPQAHAGKMDAGPLTLFMHFAVSHYREPRAWAKITLDEHLADELDLSECVQSDLESQRWWAVALFHRRSRHPHQINFLLVEQAGRVAKRIGAGVVSNLKYEYELITKIRKKFELR